MWRRCGPIKRRSITLPATISRGLNRRRIWKVSAPAAVGALLDGANIHHLVLDQNMSIIEGSIGILPRRILVHDEDNEAARQILADAGLSHELRPDE